MKNYKIDYNKLNEGLLKMTGIDFVHCEMAERRSGNGAGDIAFTKSFQARLAARALKEDYGIIQGLPLYQYNNLCWHVSNFLQLGPEVMKVTEETQAAKQEALDSFTDK